MSGSGRGKKLRLMGKYMGHLVLVARPNWTIPFGLIGPASRRSSVRRLLTAPQKARTLHECVCVLYMEDNFFLLFNLKNLGAYYSRENTLLLTGTVYLTGNASNGSV